MGLDPVVKNHLNVVMPATSQVFEPQLIKPFDELVKGLRRDGLWDDIWELNGYMSSGGTGAVGMCGTPQKIGPTGADSGLYLWSNRGSAHVDGDVTINGIVGDGSTKAFVTGIRPSGTFSSANSAGLSVYVSTHTTTGYDVGGFNAAGTALFGLGSDSGGTFNGDCWDPAVVSSLTPASPALAGFYSISRISATDFRCYFGNGSNPLAQIAVNTTASGQTWFGGAGNNNLLVGGVEFQGTMVAATARRQSFFVAHEGLTFARTQLLFNRVQTFLIRKGGGFV